MLIYSFIHTKGGVGKTTLVQCVPHTKAFQKAFKKIALIELDEQESLIKWYERREATGKKNQHIKFESAGGSNLQTVKNKIIKATEGCDAAILDVPGESKSRFATKLAIELSDVLLMPMRASTKDEDAFAGNLWPTIKEAAKKQSDEKAFCVVPAFFHPSTSLKNIKEYFWETMPEGIKCLPAFLPYRPIYENFDRDGMNLYDYAEFVKGNKRNHKQVETAIKDFEKIAKSILKL